jgi:hypothetical protein
MAIKKILPSLFYFISSCLYSIPFAQQFPTSRDPLKWPFAYNSCWNMPIGSGAVYAPAGIKANAGTNFLPDEDIIVMKPKSPMIKIYQTGAGWGGGNRCYTGTGTYRFSVPIPDNFTIASENTNASAAFLDSNSRTVIQCQPFARCKPGEPGTSMFFFDKPTKDNHNGITYDFHNMDIQDSTGEIGGHWGSKLSDLGGTIRYGELTAGIIRHAMKVNLGSHLYYNYDFNCSATDKDSCSFRWPAISVDHYSSDKNNANWYAGTDKNFIMGALLALKPSFNIDTLKTTPGKILAKAFQDYGAYVVDDAACDCWAPILERGPDGRVVDEVKAKYNVNMYGTSHNDPFWSDMVIVFQSLNIITNNGPKNIGGGGTPRQPLAPPFIGSTKIGNNSKVKKLAGSSALGKITLDLKESPIIHAGYKGKVYSTQGEIIKTSPKE